MNKIENPQAFPSVAMSDPGHPSSLPGMSLRDYFAGQVLAGLCANSGGPFQANGMCGWAIVNCDERDISGVAFKLADAMLAARSEGRS